MRYTFLNNHFVLESDAKLSAFDSAIATGDMTTEVVRTFLHKPFELDKHLTRLFDGMKELKIQMSLSKEGFTKLTYELLEKNCISEEENVEWQLIYIISRGLESLYHLFDSSECTPTLVVLCFPLKYRLAHMTNNYTDGVKLLVSKQRAIPNRLLPPQIKSRGRIHFKVANLEIKERDKNASALLLDEENFVTESTGSNVFFIKGNTLCTPPASHVLPGITRDYVMDLASELGMEVAEKKISIKEVQGYDECFITSTIIGIAHVRQLENHTFSDGNCGLMTDKIRKLFFEKVGVDFVKQAVSYIK